MTTEPPPTTRQVVLVAGAGRSGTSTVTGLLRILGMHVPQPEIVADESNPKGFGEPAWVVETHDRILDRGPVQVGDARPQAWEMARDLATERDLGQRVHAWLAGHLADHPTLVVKDPRLTWFLPTWHAAVARSDAALGVVTTLRPPAEVIGSRQKYYNAVSPTHLAASWVNLMLHTEYATRDTDSVFVRYADLLGDWREAIAGVDQRLGLGLDITGARGAEGDRFVDPALRRVTPDLADLELPRRLHDLVEATWVELDGLAEPKDDRAGTYARLDELRATYADLYREAEEMTTSTVVAARRRVRREMRARQRQHAAPTPGAAELALGRRGVDRIPHNVRAMIPAPVRRRVRRALRRMR